MWHVLALSVLAGCSSDATAVEIPIVVGIFTGEFFDSGLPFTATGTLRLDQDGAKVTGTLTGARTGTLSGNIVRDATGAQVLSGAFIFTGSCPGNATTTGDLAEADRLLGDYQGTDCNGAFSGTYNLVRQ